MVEEVVQYIYLSKTKLYDTMFWKQIHIQNIYKIYPQTYPQYTKHCRPNYLNLYHHQNPKQQKHLRI